VIAFARGEFLFVFNFSPSKSFTDYGIPVKGKFRIILDTDDPEFDGFNRVDKSKVYLSMKKGERSIINAPLYLYLYLPARSAMVLRKEASRRATDI
jgi:1,4-alpha-glucan branching enzyme